MTTIVEAQRGPAERIVGNSQQMRSLRAQAAQVAASNVNLLLQGESGTGKELIARTVHRQSGRRDGPFIGVNCAAVQESLLANELFGHDAGAYTGADRSTLGFFRAADGGTLLLDEIGDMSLTLQGKLLRVLEERAVVPVGSSQAVPVDIRVIAATHQDLARAVREGTFREDLYYRLNVVCLHLSPLREHKEDIPELVERLLGDLADIMCVSRKDVSPRAMDLLLRYDWPGNVRQLGNVLQRAYVLGCGGTILPADLGEEFTEKTDPGIAGSTPMRGGSFLSLQQAIDVHLREALNVSGGVRSQAARILGIDRKSLWRMMRRHNIA